MDNTVTPDYDRWDIRIDGSPIVITGHTWVDQTTLQFSWTGSPPAISASTEFLGDAPELVDWDGYMAYGPVLMLWNP